MKIEAMLEWSAEERAAKRKEWTQSLFTLRLQKATGQLENPMKIREVKKDLARLGTLDSLAAKGVTPAHKASAAPAAAQAVPAGEAPAAVAPAPVKKPAAKKAAPKAAPKKAAPKAPKKAAKPEKKAATKTGKKVKA